jgi:NADPH:quinone reductase-like Zn-dependent oxidoreductase
MLLDPETAMPPFSAARLLACAFLLALPTVPAAAAGDTTRVYRLEQVPGSGYRLKLDSVALRAPGPREVVIRVRATSLNRRDLSILESNYGRGDYTGRIPLSDGAGEVVAVGADVRKWQRGDRVMATFFQTWLEGKPTAASGRSALGGEIDGMLAEHVVLHEDGLVHIRRTCRSSRPRRCRVRA